MNLAAKGQLLLQCSMLKRKKCGAFYDRKPFVDVSFFFPPFIRVLSSSLKLHSTFEPPWFTEPSFKRMALSKSQLSFHLENIFFHNLLLLSQLPFFFLTALFHFLILLLSFSFTFRFLFFFHLLLFFFFSSLRSRLKPSILKKKKKTQSSIFNILRKVFSSRELPRPGNVRSPCPFLTTETGIFLY